MSHLLSIILLIISTISFGQTTDPKTHIIGKWVIVQHTLVVNGKPVDHLKGRARIIYEFKIDGTYILTSAFKYKEKWETEVRIGKWKISSDNKEIELFSNKILPPHDK